MGRVLHKYKGKVVTQEELDVLVPRKADWLSGPPMVANTYTEHDPLVSDGCGVMKSQVGETRDLIKVHGIQGAAVMDNGQIRFTSRNARRNFLRMRGLVDNDGSYGD